MDELLTYLKPSSKISEDFRKLRVKLEAFDEVKLLLITSASNGEGKTFVASNLAISLAKDEKKVLLIDCDFTRGKISKIFKVENSKGLSNILSSTSDIDYEKYISKTSVENLSIIFCGTIKSNSSELLGSRNFKKVLDKVKKDYDYIIIDSPSVLKKSDTLVLASRVDGTLLVASSGITKQDDIVKAKSELNMVGANIIGMILNKENRG